MALCNYGRQVNGHWVRCTLIEDQEHGSWHRDAQGSYSHAVAADLRTIPVMNPLPKVGDPLPAPAISTTVRTLTPEDLAFIEKIAKPGSYELPSGKPDLMVLRLTCNTCVIQWLSCHRTTCLRCGKAGRLDNGRPVLLPLTFARPPAAMCLGETAEEVGWENHTKEDLGPLPLYISAILGEEEGEPTMDIMGLDVHFLKLLLLTAKEHLELDLARWEAHPVGAPSLTDRCRRELMTVECLLKTISDPTPVTNGW